MFVQIETNKPQQQNANASANMCKRNFNSCYFSDTAYGEISRVIECARQVSVYALCAFDVTDTVSGRQRKTLLRYKM